MLARWAALLKFRKNHSLPGFRQSLVRTVLIALLLTSLFPILLIGSLNLVRTRNLLAQQTAQQAARMLAYEVAQIEQYVDLRSQMMDRLAADAQFQDAVKTLLREPVQSQEHANARSLIDFSFRANPNTAAEGFFDQVFLIRPDGVILLASDDRWIVSRFGGIRVSDPFIRSLIGTNLTNLVLESESSLVVFAARSLMDENGKLLATMIATVQSRPEDPTFRTLTDTAELLEDATSFYISPRAGLLGVSEAGFTPYTVSEDVQASLTSFVRNDLPGVQPFTGVVDGQKITGYAQWMPQYKLGLALVVPDLAAMRPGSLIDSFNLILLAVCITLAAGLIYFGSVRLVRPLVQLAATANDFSRGNWEARAPVTRSDEIGLLAYSFNNMADELSALYRSLESEIEKRSSTLRMAAEIAQLSTSAVGFRDTPRRMAELLAERFGYKLVSIYLIDSSGRWLALSVFSGTAAHPHKPGERIPVNDATLIGRAAAAQILQITARSPENTMLADDSLASGMCSAIAIPILSGKTLLGVMDIQSDHPDAFDEGNASIFQALANQISSTLQASQMLATAQFSHQETSLLYRVTRKVTGAQNEDEVLTALAETLQQMPYISALFAVEEPGFRLQVVIDPQTGHMGSPRPGMIITNSGLAPLLQAQPLVLLEDLQHPGAYEPVVAFLHQRGCKYAALIAIEEHGRISRLLAIGATESSPLTQAGLQPFENLGAVLGSTFEKIHLFEALQSRLKALQILAQYSEAISAETDLERLYHLLHQQVEQTFGGDLAFAVAIWNASEQQIAFPYFFENGERVAVRSAPLGKGLTSQLIEQRQPLLLTTAASVRALNPIIEGEAPCSWMGVPLLFAGDVVGALIIQDLQHENRFTQDDLTIFAMLAPQIATAIRNAQQYTATQQALQAYNQEHFLLNTLLESIPEAVSFKDPQGRFIRASRSAAALTGHAGETFDGKTDFDILDSETAQHIRQVEQAVLDRGQPETGILGLIAGADGEPLWLHTSRIPIATTAGDPYGLLVVQRDVTELKQAEALAQKRAEQMKTAAEIALDTAGAMDQQALLRNTIHLVRERFGYDHASVFMIDAAGEYAELRESTGPAGEQLLRTGHRLAVGSKSIVGRAAAAMAPVMVNDMVREPNLLPNPLLPETRSEMAIPVQVEERLLGVIDLHSTQANAFTSEDMHVLRIIANQLAIALEKAALFATAQDTLRKYSLMQQINRAASANATFEDAILSVVRGLHASALGDRVALLVLGAQEVLHVQASAGFTTSRFPQVRLAPESCLVGRSAMEKRILAAANEPAIPGDPENDAAICSALAVPLLFRGEIIGVLSLESRRPAAYGESDYEVFKGLSNTLAGMFTNIRLVNQVRQQVVRERQLYEITSSVRRSVDMDTILETSTREIARALGARSASIRITAGADRQEPENGKETNQ